MKARIIFNKEINKTKTEIRNLQESTTKLDLSSNNFMFIQYTGAELKEIFSCLPKSITTLNLAANFLGLCKKADELKVAFSGLPTSITTLDLSINDLCNKTGAELKEAFSTLPTSITTLKFAWNYLGQHTAELKEFIAAIPKSVTKIDISHNKLFENRTAKERDEIIEILNPKKENEQYRFEEVVMKNNGEPAFARAFIPFFSLHKENRLNQDVIAKILAYLLPDSTKPNPRHFSNKMLSDYQKERPNNILSAKATEIMQQAKKNGIKHETKNAYAFIHGLLKAYSEKISGNQIFLNTIGLFTNHLQAHHTAGIRKLLVEDKYRSFDKQTLTEFFQAVIALPSFKNINSEGELFAILKAARYLTDVKVDLYSHNATI